MSEEIASYRLAVETVTDLVRLMNSTGASNKMAEFGVRFSEVLDRIQVRIELLSTVDSFRLTEPIVCGRIGEPSCSIF